ncbi:MAG: phosphate ABC transporter ATP-binding protein [Oligoflexales bacterium]
MEDVVFEVKDLSVLCKGLKIIHNASFVTRSKSVTAIVGPSGVGKSTLIRTLNRLLEEEPSYKINGEILFNGQSVYAGRATKYDLRRRVGLVFQKPTIFPTSIFRNVIFGTRHVLSFPKKEYANLVEACLRDAFLWDEVKDRIHESAFNLSVGQQQRLAIARTLAVEPDVLLMDEPTSALDVNATAKIEHLISSLRKTKTVIIVTHNLDQARRLSDQVLSLKPSEQGASLEVMTTKENRT